MTDKLHAEVNRFARFSSWSLVIGVSAFLFWWIGVKKSDGVENAGNRAIKEIERYR